MMKHLNVSNVSCFEFESRHDITDDKAFCYIYIKYGTLKLSIFLSKQESLNKIEDETSYAVLLM